jgi:hypothetical protein
MFPNHIIKPTETKSEQNPNPTIFNADGIKLETDLSKTKFILGNDITKPSFDGKGMSFNENKKLGRLNVKDMDQSTVESELNEMSTLIMTNTTEINDILKEINELNKYRNDLITVSTKYDTIKRQLEEHRKLLVEHKQDFCDDCKVVKSLCKGYWVIDNKKICIDCKCSNYCQCKKSLKGLTTIYLAGIKPRQLCSVTCYKNFAFKTGLNQVYPDSVETELHEKVKW